MRGLEGRACGAQDDAGRATRVLGGEVDVKQEAAARVGRPLRPCRACASVIGLKGLISPDAFPCFKVCLILLLLLQQAPLSADAWTSAGRFINESREPDTLQ